MITQKFACSSWIVFCRSWQEPSFYANHNFSEDSYKEKSYYGIKGIKKMSNTMLVFVLIGFTAVGVGLQVLAIV